ncbi:MAG: hypothetical protein KIPDCIKN_03084 [Haliscomenobacter sp.]|jgi:short subunit fatty acids transporter|nr:hypothetical protein [Haliscomenobacter sp.]
MLPYLGRPTFFRFPDPLVFPALTNIILPAADFDELGKENFSRTDVFFDGFWNNIQLFLFG